MWILYAESRPTKQRSLQYIRSQPDDNTYFIDASSDGTRVATEVVHKEEDQMIPHMYWTLK